MIHFTHSNSRFGRHYEDISHYMTKSSEIHSMRYHTVTAPQKILGGEQELGQEPAVNKIGIFVPRASIGLVLWHNGQPNCK